MSINFCFYKQILTHRSPPAPISSISLHVEFSTESKIVFRECSSSNLAPVTGHDRHRHATGVQSLSVCFIMLYLSILLHQFVTRYIYNRAFTAASYVIGWIATWPTLSCKLNDIVIWRLCSQRSAAKKSIARQRLANTQFARQRIGCYGINKILHRNG